MSNMIQFPNRKPLYPEKVMTEIRNQDPKVLFPWRYGHDGEHPKLARAFEAVAVSTAKTYRSALRLLDEWLNGRQLTDDTLAAYCLQLHEDGKSPGTINTMLSSVRFRAEMLGEPVPIGPETKRARLIFRRQGATRGKGQARPIKKAEVHKIIRQGEKQNTPWSIRDSAIVATMFYGGLRSAEVPEVNIEDLEILDSGHGRLSIRQSKADQFGRGATVDLHRYAVEKILNWTRLARISRGPIFPRIMTCGFNGAPPKVTDQPINKIHVAYIVKQIAKRAGVNDISSHSMRRGMATHLDEKGLTARQIQRQGRWASLDMVSRYIAGNRRQSEAVLGALD